MACTVPVGLRCLWDSPGKNADVICHALLQGIFLTQGSHLCFFHLLHWQAGSLPLATLVATLISVFKWGSHQSSVPSLLFFSSLGTFLNFIIIMIYFVGIPEKKVYIYILYPSKCYSRQLVRCEQRNGAKGKQSSSCKHWGSIGSQKKEGTFRLTGNYTFWMISFPEQANKSGEKWESPGS